MRLIEAFIARRAFVAAGTREYSRLFVELVAGLHGKSVETVEPTLRQRLLSGGGATRYWPTDDEVIKHAISRPAFGVLKPPALRLVLERLELASRTKKSEVAPIKPNLQMEHVLPQKWAEHWPLQGQSVPDAVASYPYLTAQDAYREFAPLADAIRTRSNVLHMLGNLTLVNRYLNPAASNAAYADKLVQYANSVLRLNRYFVGIAVWDEATITRRGHQLAQLLCMVWPRPHALETATSTSAVTATDAPAPPAV